MKKRLLGIAALAFLGASAPQEPFCATLSVGASRFVVDQQLDIRAATQRPGRFDYRSRSGAPIAAIMCRRASPLPLPEDYKVAAAGWPFYLQSMNAITVLEKKEQGYSLRLMRGKLTPMERAELPARMAALERRASKE